MGSLRYFHFFLKLDFRVDEKKLKEVFRLAGRVLEVDLNRDKDGKSRGHGVIEFEHPVEAVQAICKKCYIINIDALLCHWL